MFFLLGLLGVSVAHSGVAALALELHQYRLFDFLEDGIVVLVASGLVFLGVRGELRTRNQLEGVLRESEAKYRALVETANEGIWAVDAEGVTTYTNPRLTRMLGYTAEEMVGRPLVDFMNEEGRAVAALSLRQRALGVQELEEFRFRHKDGSGIWTQANISAFLDSDGAYRGAIAMITDITDRKRAEEQLRKSEEQLRHSQKLEAVGQLAGGVAHDFNNILTVITGRVHFLLKDLAPAHAPHREDLEEIQKAASRAAALTRQLLAFSRKQVQRPQPLDLNAIVGGLSKMLRRLIRENVELVTDLTPSLGVVVADPTQLEQVIVNLVVNAGDAMPDGGRLEVRTRNSVIDEAQATAYWYDVRPGRYVVLEVSDTGHGMDAVTRERVFEPFFTTKERGRGTGLGLSTVYGIVKQSRGYIWVDSEVGQGATFTIYLPVSDEPVAAGGPAGEDASAPEVTSTGVILLVEDEASVRTIVRDALQRAGFRVFEAVDGFDALRVAREQRGTIDLLLTDVIMPKMGGRELAERLRRLAPDLKVLYSTGYAEGQLANRGILGADIPLIEKPYKPDRLVARVREVLDGGRG